MIVLSSVPGCQLIGCTQAFAGDTARLDQWKSASVLKKILKISCRKKHIAIHMLFLSGCVILEMDSETFNLPHNMEKALKMNEEGIVSTYILFQKTGRIYFVRLPWEERRENIGTG